VSLRVHVGRSPAHGQHFIPSADQRAKVVASVASRLPCVPFDDAPTDEELVRLTEKFLAGSHVNWAGGPGYPFQTRWATNREVIEFDYVEFVSCVVSLLQMLRDVPEEHLQTLDALTAYLGGLAWPERVFIKNEPHSEKKMTEERFRLIISDSFVVSTAHAVLLQPWLDAMVDSHASIGAKPGMGLNQLGIEQVWDWVQKAAEVHHVLNSNDVSMWDFSVQMWLLDMSSDVYVLGRKAEGLWKRMIKNAYTLHPDALIVLSDGRTFRKIRKGGVSTGSRATAAGNSVQRLCLQEVKYCAVGLPIIPTAGAAMGDDCVESLLPEGEPQQVAAYARMGFKLTDLMVVKAGTPFDFCSHLFVSRTVAIPTAWQRTLWRLLQRPYTAEDFQAWLFEMRHLADPRASTPLWLLVDFLHWIGWLPTPVDVQKLIVPQAGQLEITQPVHYASGKSTESTPQGGESCGAAPAQASQSASKGNAYQGSPTTNERAHQPADKAGGSDARVRPYPGESLDRGAFGLSFGAWLRDNTYQQSSAYLRGPGDGEFCGIRFRFSQHGRLGGDERRSHGCTSCAVYLLLGGDAGLSHLVLRCDLCGRDWRNHNEFTGGCRHKCCDWADQDSNQIAGWHNQQPNGSEVGGCGPSCVFGCTGGFGSGQTGDHRDERTVKLCSQRRLATEQLYAVEWRPTGPRVVSESAVCWMEIRADVARCCDTLESSCLSDERIAWNRIGRIRLSPAVCYPVGGGVHADVHISDCVRLRVHVYDVERHGSGGRPDLQRGTGCDQQYHELNAATGSDKAWPARPDQWWQHYGSQGVVGQYSRDHARAGASADAIGNEAGPNGRAHEQPREDVVQCGPRSAQSDWQVRPILDGDGGQGRTRGAQLSGTVTGVDYRKLGLRMYWYW